MDQVLAQVVLAREAHGAELAVHLPGEAAIRVDPAAEPVARLQDRDAVARLLEQQPGGQAGDARADDRRRGGSGPSLAGKASRRVSRRSIEPLASFMAAQGIGPPGTARA